MVAKAVQYSLMMSIAQAHTIQLTMRSTIPLYNVILKTLSSRKQMVATIPMVKFINNQKLRQSPRVFYNDFRRYGFQKNDRRDVIISISDYAFFLYAVTSSGCQYIQSHKGPFAMLKIQYVPIIIWMANIL